MWWWSAVYTQALSEYSLIMLFWALSLRLLQVTAIIQFDLFNLIYIAAKQYNCLKALLLKARRLSCKRYAFHFQCKQKRKYDRNHKHFVYHLFSCMSSVIHAEINLCFWRKNESSNMSRMNGVMLSATTSVYTDRWGRISKPLWQMKDETWPFT